MMRRAIVVAVALMAAMSASCGNGAPKPAAAAPDKPPEKTPAERLTGAKLPETDLIDQQGDGTAGILVVIGENHASVRSQREVEATLSALSAAKPLDAVGVEGSLGPIPVPAAQVSTLSTLAPAKRREHTRALIDWGEVSGAEAFILDNPSIPYTGIENLGAKGRWELAEEMRAAADIAMVERMRSDEIAKAVACLGDPAARDRNVVAARTRLETAQKLLATAQAAYTKAMEPINRLTARQASLSDDDDTVIAFQRLTWAFWAAELDNRYKKAEKENNAALLRDLDHARATFKQMFPDGTAPLEHPSQAIQDHFMKQLDLIKDGDAAAKDPNLKHAIEARSAASSDVADAFAEVASEIGQRDSGARCTRRVLHFQSEVVTPAMRNSVADLSERDENMVRRTLALVQPNKRVAIIIGSAHLPGVIKRLKERSAPFLAVAVKSRDEEIAVWEERAWARRKEHQNPIFVAGLEDTMKEASRMIQPSWWQNFAERAHVASELTGSSPTRGRVVRSAGGQRVIRDALPGQDVTLVVGDIGLGPKVDVGGQVASRGITPATGPYTAFDIKTAHKLVGDLSKGDNHFAFARLSDDGSAPILDVPAPGKGTRPLGMPEIATGGSNGGGRKPPRRLVVFDAMDGESSRQFAHDLRTPDDHGVPTWRRLASDSLLSTVNPERAARNLKLIEKQEPARIASVQVIRGANLEGLLPTPARGDHALTVVLLARNVEEFRTNVTKASRDGLLEGKHVALITCGDAFQATADLREEILNGGAAMVWTPERQLSEGLGEALAGEIQNTVTGLPANHKHTTVDTIMRTTIDRMKAPGGHLEAPLLDESKSWVMLFPARRRDWLRGLS